jgi:Mrp family chromosome partitioning ATPase/capsular polysaccharide biosynthesis protein
VVARAGGAVVVGPGVVVVVVVVVGPPAASVADGASLAGASPPQPTSGPRERAAMATRGRAAAMEHMLRKVTKRDHRGRLNSRGGPADGAGTPLSTARRRRGSTVAPQGSTTDLALVRSLARHWIVALLAFSVCVALGAAAAFLPEKSYEATATVSVEPTTGQQASAGVQTINFLVPSFISRLESRPFRELVAERLPRAVAEAPVQVKGSAESGTGVIAVTVTSTARSATAAWANGLAEALLDQQAPAEEPPAPPPSADSTTTTTVQVLSLSVINPASVPNRPSSPQVVPLLLGSALLGGIAALFVSQMAARLRQSRDLPEQLRLRLGVPVLGEIPFIWRWRRRPVPVAQLLGDDSPQRREAIQRLRVNVQLAMLDRQPRAVAVASTGVGEGKSTMTTAIGASLAYVGHQVTLIDADLRRPTLHQRTEQPLSPGLADLREGDAGSLVRPTGVPGLSVVTAGVPAGHPADVVARRIPVALRELGGAGSLLLIDSPPLHLAAESRQVASEAGSVILVARARKVKLARLEKLVEELRSARVEVLGIVLNRTRRRSLPKQYYGPSPSVGARAADEGPAVQVPAPAAGADR